MIGEYLYFVIFRLMAAAGMHFRALTGVFCGRGGPNTPGMLAAEDSCGGCLTGRMRKVFMVNG